ncbi:uncharacterized protein LOC110609739 [Manihot esculenta]|uniref:DUF4228 domain-containing protein n=1 Tax=Manihot esculenta TaxID=3983 RepID=A0A2C9WDQ2_MANES|nr:uncharacterized protein LOC110609739 [Manihot esculenta]OAY57980.1 hypothetical protein MANES_02G139900v8 [Manihot esculenta]
MGNALSPCFHQTRSSPVKLIFWEGATRILAGKHIAGEIMFENPDKIICHADSFFIGHPIPALAIDDELKPGQTYFLLPIDRISFNHVLSAASLAALTSSSCPTPAPINFSECDPFQYVKGPNGRILIKVVPEFITRLLNRGKEQENNGSASENGNSFLCSTPELKKHYEQLVRSKEQTWSPKLETISEFKIRYSPCRLLGLEWKQKEENYA